MLDRNWILSTQFKLNIINTIPLNIFLLGVLLLASDIKLIGVCIDPFQGDTIRIRYMGFDSIQRWLNINTKRFNTIQYDSMRCSAICLLSATGLMKFEFPNLIYKVKWIGWPSNTGKRWMASKYITPLCLLFQIDTHWHVDSDTK